MTEGLNVQSDAVIPPTVPPDHVLVTIDGKQLVVKKGTNLIEAAKLAGVEVPHYCYHPHLSIAGNCRMCQVHVAGRPKLEIACNTTVADGMQVSTHKSSKDVADAQAAVLEFILVNHPLDCTVCDQAGHCKLQDYHFEYNAKPSRVTTEKEHKVKAEPLGPTVMLDGERCIMCTRCIRFCDEISETSELGMLNRGDHSVISINPGKELNNPFSGTVVDLCPVGALTHKEWRFNTRVWFTKKSETICAGCSTGCNVTVHTRDSEVVNVKARRNDSVNKEWLCDEGRYGMQKFLPKDRTSSCYIDGRTVDIEDALSKARQKIEQGKTLVVLSGDVLLEDLHELSQFSSDKLNFKAVDDNIERTDLEKKLLQNNRCGNIEGIKFFKLYNSSVNFNDFSTVLCIGDRALEVAKEITDTKNIISLQIKEDLSPSVIFPIRSYLERSGLMLNFQSRLQYLSTAEVWPNYARSTWKIIRSIFGNTKYESLKSITDRERTLELLNSKVLGQELSIRDIKTQGIQL